MKCRPILFSAPMVRAILDGSKTQTRRVVKTRVENASRVGKRGAQAHIESPEALNHCPYGQPGDRLWVRETFGQVGENGRYVYCANPADDYQWGAGKPSQGGFRWRPSIHMPRVASRITLEITDVRVERLQDISEEDARAEGITDGGCTECGEHEPCGCANPSPDARDAFCWLWQSINGADSWSENPWVWVISFRRVTG
jgi:hypothetical protein